MTEFDELKAEVVALRAEVDKWKAITIDVLGKASRAQGFAEGVSEGANMQIKFLTSRIDTIENRSLSPTPKQFFDINLAQADASTLDDILARYRCSPPNSGEKL